MRRHADLVVALVLIALHAVAVSGYTGLYWGDIGRWLHEVERFALGEVPYRDFHWHYPPLGLWVVGFAARVLGTDIAPVFVITATLAGLLVITAVLYSREVLERRDPWVVFAALVLAFAYAQTNGAPLPAGLYSPAVLVGALCITIAVVGWLRAWRSGDLSGSWWMALFAGLAVIAKQDFWLPAAYLVGFHVLRFRRLTPVMISGATVALGVAIVAMTASPSVLRPLVGGFNHARIAGGMGFPSWERITVEIFVASLIVGFVLTVAGVARRRIYLLPLLVSGVTAFVAAGLHVMVSLSVGPGDIGPFPTPTVEVMQDAVLEGRSQWRPAIGWLKHRAIRDPIPYVLIALMLVMTGVRWTRLDVARRSTVALLLGFAFVLRTRRAFEGTEWFEFVLTLPVLLAGAELLFGFSGPALRRFRIGVIAAITLMAGAAHYVHGRGPGTRRHFPGAVITRGTVHWPPDQVTTYRRVRAAIDSVDPSGERPLFAYGFSGGWNYFMERRNPYPFTQDFMFSAFDADSVLATRPPGLILVDHSFLDGSSFTSVGVRLDRWEQERVPSPYTTYDRPRFDRLRDGCEAVFGNARSFRVYVCP